MEYTRRTELRKITPAELRKIAVILNSQSAWKKLMEYVPLRLTDAEHWEDGTPRYRIDDIGLIENTRNLKLPSEIFLEEWATSGGVRPTLGHLLQFLVNIELFRAADYVARLLSEPPPTRPDTGPAARVDIDLALLENNSISQELYSMVYPDSSQLMNMTGPNNNKDFFNKQNLDRVVKVNDISITGKDARDIPSTSAGRSHIPSASSVQNHLQNHPSTSAVRNDIPSTSAGQNHPSTSAGQNHPSTSTGQNTITELNHSHSTSEESSSSPLMPDFSNLISNQRDQNFPSISHLQSDSRVIPNVSLLGHNQSPTSTSSLMMSSSNSDSGDTSNVPNFSLLGHNSGHNQSHSSSPISQRSNYNESADDGTSSSSLIMCSRNSDSGDTSNIPNFSQLNIQSGEHDSEQEFSANFPHLSGLIVPSVPVQPDESVQPTAKTTN